MRLKKQSLIMPVLTSLSLLSMTGCYGTAPLKPVKSCPPQTLYSEHSLPAWEGKTWGDVAQWALEVAAVVDEQNANNKGIQEFCR